MLYVSPLKALAVDVERNLRAPLRGIGLAAARLGLPMPEIAVAVRSGDTPANERRRILTHPPDVLITTPESLFLMLSSRAVEVLRDVHTVILDEVHALAGTKRGAHLMVSIERLQALHPDRPIQRIALSATVNPVERVAAFVGGAMPVTVVAPPTGKTWNLSIEVPVPDLTDLRSPADAGDPDAATTQSIWPFLEARLLELVSTHRSTICFVNSRRVAERVTAHLNERWRDLHPPDPDPDARAEASARPPAEVLAQSGTAAAHSPGDIARAHHGSVSKERRAAIEAELKSGALRCVVATSALELGIDMGAVDLVIQVQSPPSVASGLQRIGRAGHQVNAVSSGVILPAHRSDLLEAVVVADRMIAGRIESVARLTNPLDVLAQQIVSICLEPGHTARSVFDLVRRSDPYRDLPWSAYEAVLEMLSGRYPSEDFAELRPRLTWDRATGVLEARPGARRLVTTSGGTIPDRGLFGVFLPAGDDTGTASTGRRVGELDEEMVYESRVGDVFTLGTSSWRIQDITPNQVIVTPAPGQVSRLPFWHGDQPARPMELGRAIAGFVDELGSMPPPDARTMLQERGLDAMAADNLLAYLADQREATGTVPGARTIVVERFRDELGDWRLCLHAPLGTAVLSPWALAIEAAARERYGVEAHASATNDGIIVRIPDIESAPPGADLVSFDGDDVEGIVTREVSGSALFAARFRECAGRALLLPRRDPTRRSPLWQQRMRAAQLLSVAAGHPQFPIVLETMRECLEDVFDLPALRQVLDDVAARRVRLVEVETGQPSPFARSLLFGYVGEFIYDGDQPLAERRVAALGLDPALLSELLGREGGDALFDLDVAAEVERELQCLDASHRAFSAESLWDLIRTVGPLTRDECVERSEPDADVDGWLGSLADARRVGGTTVHATAVVAVGDDHALLRDALGIPVPPGVATGPQTGANEALDRLVLRWLLTHVVVTPADLSGRYGIPGPVGEQALGRFVASGVAVRLDDDTARRHGAVVHRQVLQRVRRRTLARLRAGVEPVEAGRLAGFLAEWHELDDPAEGPDALLAAIELLAGYPVPVSMLESMVLPARVPGYHPALLDQALAAGEIVWSGHAPIGRSDGWVQLWPADAVLPTGTGAEPTGTRGGAARPPAGRGRLDAARPVRRHRRRARRRLGRAVGARVGRPPHQRHVRAGAGDGRLRCAADAATAPAPPAGVAAGSSPHAGAGRGVGPMDRDRRAGGRQHRSCGPRRPTRARAPRRRPPGQRCGRTAVPQLDRRLPHAVGPRGRRRRAPRLLHRRRRGRAVRPARGGRPASGRLVHRPPAAAGRVRPGEPVRRRGALARHGHAPSQPPGRGPGRARRSPPGGLARAGGAHRRHLRRRRRTARGRVRTHRPRRDRGAPAGHHDRPDRPAARSRRSPRPRHPRPGRVRDDTAGVPGATPPRPVLTRPPRRPPWTGRAAPVAPSPLPPLVSGVDPIAMAARGRERRGPAWTGDRPSAPPGWWRCSRWSTSWARSR